MKQLVCLLMCVTGIALFVSACGSEAEKACPDDKVLARVDQVEGCYVPCDNGACDPGFQCTSGICLSTESGTNNPFNNTNTNNPTNNINNVGTNNPLNNLNNPSNNTTNNGTNNTSNNQNNATNNGTNSNSNNATNNVNNNPIDPAAQQACERACDLLYGSCFTNNCTLTPEDTQALQNLEQDCLNNLLNDGVSCAQSASNDAQLLMGIQNVASQTCDELSSLRCGEFGLTQSCGCSAPSGLGQGCTQPSDCNAGDLDAGCIPQVDMDGNQTGWTGGYCYAFPCPQLPNRTAPYSYRSSACGPNGICRVLENSSGDTFSICIGDDSSCTRAGYSPQVLGLQQGSQGQPVFMEGCLPSCSQNSDCGTTGFCSQGSCLIECGTTPIDGMQGPTPTQICTNSGGTCISGNGSTYCSL